MKPSVFVFFAVLAVFLNDSIGQTVRDKGTNVLLSPKGPLPTQKDVRGSKSVRRRRSIRGNKQLDAAYQSGNDSAADNGLHLRPRRLINIARDSWDKNVPIAYRLDASLEPYARDIIVYSLNFWQEHTCLNFEENGNAKPIVKFFKEAGCWSHVGKRTGEDEQELSIGGGCDNFGATTHEIGHLLGLEHEFSRPDRDQYIEIVNDAGEPDQFKIEPTTETDGKPYDYGSVMQYPGAMNDGTIAMRAKKPAYQSMMGNRYGPNFLDVRTVNRHYKCSEHCTGTVCHNGGYPHPRDCSKCLCPQGFGGTDCIQVGPGENGAPHDCQQAIKAQASQGKRIQMRFAALDTIKEPKCIYGYTEVKYEDLLLGGIKVCSYAESEALGTITSSQETVVIGVCTAFDSHGSTIEYREVDPPSGCRKKRSGDASGSACSVKRPFCADKYVNCVANAHLCKTGSYALLMKQVCARTCKHCS